MNIVYHLQKFSVQLKIQTWRDQNKMLKDYRPTEGEDVQ